MRSPALTAALCLALLAPQGASAAEAEAFLIDTAADLARLCGAPATHPNHTAAVHMCHGFIVGAHHFHTAFAAATGAPVYCVERAEPEPTRDEVAAAFTAWVGATPGAGEKEALIALLDWAALSFPCE